MKPRFAQFALLGVLALAACPAAETPEQASARLQTESDSARAAIDAINVRYAAFMNGNMSDSVALLFTENGVMMPPGAPAVVGRDSIRASLTRQGMPPGSSMSFRAVEVVASGPVAIERGTYLFSMPAMGRTPAVSMPGKYLSHWHKVNGQWLQASVSWSDDRPAPPM